MRLRQIALVAVTVVPLLASCKQGIGDRCQVISDCDDGLICVYLAGGMFRTGGTCQPAGGAPSDMSLGDAASDAGSDAH